jgi:hypothetical protein
VPHAHSHLRLHVRHHAVTRGYPMTKHSREGFDVACFVVMSVLLSVLGCIGARQPRELAPFPSTVSSPNETERSGTRSSSPAEDRRAEFEYRRVHAATGQFITERELERLTDLPLIDALRTHLRDFPPAPDARQSTAGDLDSPLEVYVNGLRASAIDGVRPADLMGVEYYRARTAAPARYQRPFSSAAVLLLWLKP